MLFCWRFIRTMFMQLASIAEIIGVHVLGWGRFGHTEKVLNLRKYPSKLPYEYE